MPTEMNLDPVLEEWNERRRSNLESFKDELIEALYLWPQIRKIQIHYEGSGDSGGIEFFEFLSETGARVEVPENDALETAAANLTYELLPGGWEINEGSSGTLYYDVETASGRLEHSQNIMTTDDSTMEF